MAKQPFPKATAEAVLARAAGRCERCGLQNLKGHLHHRQPRGMGSSTGSPHAVENVVSLDESCHRWVHSHPRESYAAGWLVRHPDDPADVPVVGWLGTVYLTPDGSTAASRQR